MLQVYDKVLTSYNISTLVVITLAAIIALTVLACLEWLRSRLLVRAGIEFDRVLSLPVLHENLKKASKPEGDQRQGIVRDVQLLRNFLGGNSVFAFFDVPWMPIYFILIFILHPALGMVALSGAIVVLLLGYLTERLTRKNLEAANSLNNNANNFLGTIINNSSMIRSMGMITAVSTRWENMNKVVIELQTRASKHAGMLHSISKSTRLGLQVLIYAVGAYLTIMQQSTAGIMIAASIIMGRALAPIDLAMATYKQSLEAHGAYKRLKILLDVPASTLPMDLPPPTGEISTEGLFFAIQGRPLVKGVTFRLPAGQSMALIGPSAAGKSTLCKLLLGIWLPNAGKVRVDGADLATWDMEKLGQYIGYLPQDVELFTGTIAENIARMGDVISENVIQAAKLAGVHELVLKLPKGYDTHIGQHGGGLSGGQRQRIGLARAVYGNPRIIVLDEPNSNLDEEGELSLLQVIGRLKQINCTVILVTHKPNILSIIDNILLMREGQIALCGSRSEVMAKLAEMQKKQHGKNSRSHEQVSQQSSSSQQNTTAFSSEERYGSW